MHEQKAPSLFVVTILFALHALPVLQARAASMADGDWKAARMNMVDEQLLSRGRDIRNPRVIEAMRTVPRHLLVPEDVRPMAYGDHPLPIGHGQTISQPYIVAFMTEILDPQPGDRVLEIGTGSGYQAAILAQLVEQVYTIEIVGPLAERAMGDLHNLGYKNIHVRAGDGYLGWPEAAPFDSIIVTCAPENIPQPLVEQLREGGRMIIPIGGLHQELVLLKKIDGEIQKQAVLPVRFVPMTGKAQGNDNPARD
jgi:protein-L-isoaspartate(D-aspartate) O-methyltransferase